MPSALFRDAIWVAEPRSEPTESWIQYLDRTRRELEAAGHPTMAGPELLRHIDELRGDDDRIESIRREMEADRCFGGGIE